MVKTREEIQQMIEQIKRDVIADLKIKREDLGDKWKLPFRIRKQIADILIRDNPEHSELIMKWCIEQ